MIIWLYGCVSVVIISITGLVMIVFLPLLQNDHQSNTSQFFVGLAVGTLCSDALLHLLPHAFSSQSDHHFDNETEDEHPEFHTESSHSHSDSVWYGLLALAGIIGFLFFERIATIFIDLFNQPSNSHHEEQKGASCSRNTAEFLGPELDKLNNLHPHHEMEDLSSVINGKNVQDLQVHDECHRSTISFPKPNGEGYVHITAHHHHHKAHRGPSATLMVLLGDLVHNLFDGLAIGVAFAGSGISGGISTSIAVFCHEIPHELGDFTIIIRSGMRLRNAIFWNCLASLICFLGMAIGIILGSIKDAWLSALIGGTFLYISLVDMVPELDSCPHLPSKSRAIKLTVQLIGILIGIMIMFFISVYENKLNFDFLKPHVTIEQPTS